MSTYRFIYANDRYQSLMWGIIADSRATIPSIKNAIGDIIKAYVDSQIALVTPGVSVYKIETELGCVAGYLGIQASGNPGSVVFLQVRPPFEGDILAINQQISNFIASGGYIFDSI